MKKLLAILLVALMVVLMASCGNKKDSGNGDVSSTGSTTSNESTVSNPSDTSVPVNSSDVASSTESEVNTTPSKLSATIKGEPLSEYEIVWDETDETKGVIEFAEIMHAPEDSLKQLGFKAPLSLKGIEKYNVTYTKEGDTYTVSGTISAVKMSIIGPSADKYIKMAKEGLEDSELDKMTAKVLDGETLTKKEDIENFTWQYNTKIKVVFTLNDGKVTVKSFSKEYTEWGTMDELKEVYTVNNGVVRVVDTYNGGELANRVNYRADGTKEKETYYNDGEVSNVVNYDKDGNVIEE